MKKILFITSPYKTTNLLLYRTMEIAKREGVELKFTIVDEFDGAKLIKNEEFDLVLLNPLLRFLLNNTDENIFTLSGKSPIKMLDSKIYGSLNAEALYKLIVS